MNGTQPLITRHRPTSFAQVRGHTSTIQALQRRLAEPGCPHTYLLTGPSGVGKTTLARLIGDQLEAQVVEVDAASRSGVDDMRALCENVGHFLSPTQAQSRLIILDECHRLSQQAWDSSLKTIEEPPEHLYWCLCTTNLQRVPLTIQTRSFPLKLERLSDTIIENLLIDVMYAEDWETITQPEVLQLVAREAEGSPRLALSLFQMCYDAPDLGEAKRIIALHGMSAEPMRQILSMLMTRQGGWDHIQPILSQMTDEDFTEQSIIGACRYIIGGLNRETSEKQAQHFWSLLASLTYPAHGYDPKSLFYAAVGRALWSTV